MALSVLITITLFVVLLTSSKAGFDEWWNFVGLVVAQAAIAVISIKPSLIGKQMVFNFKEKKFNWKKKKHLRDVGNYQYVINGTVALWLSLIFACGTMLDLRDSDFWGKMTFISLCLGVITFAVIIWATCKMYKTGGFTNE